MFHILSQSDHGDVNVFIMADLVLCLGFVGVMVTMWFVVMLLV